jgi:hypothetical protein
MKHHLVLLLLLLIVEEVILTAVQRKTLDEDVHSALAAAASFHIAAIGT